MTGIFELSDILQALNKTVSKKNTGSIPAMFKYLFIVLNLFLFDSNLLSDRLNLQKVYPVLLKQFHQTQQKNYSSYLNTRRLYFFSTGEPSSETSRII